MEKHSILDETEGRYNSGVGMMRRVCQEIGGRSDMGVINEYIGRIPERDWDLDRDGATIREFAERIRGCLGGLLRAKSRVLQGTS
jgi:hypothetical protein